MQKRKTNPHSRYQGVLAPRLPQESQASIGEIFKTDSILSRSFGFLLVPMGIVFLVGCHSTSIDLGESISVGFHKSSVVDFGQTRPKTTVSKTIVLRNELEFPITVKEVFTSCSCTKAIVEERVFAPGNDIPVTVTYDSPDTMLDDCKSIILTFDDIRVQPYEITVKANVRPSAFVSPTSINGISVSPGQKTMFEIRLVNYGTTEWSEFEFKCDKEWLKWTCERLERTQWGPAFEGASEIWKAECTGLVPSELCGVLKSNTEIKAKAGNQITMSTDFSASFFHADVLRVIPQALVLGRLSKEDTDGFVTVCFSEDIDPEFHGISIEVSPPGLDFAMAYRDRRSLFLKIPRSSSNNELIRRYLLDEGSKVSLRGCFNGASGHVTHFEVPIVLFTK